MEIDKKLMDALDSVEKKLGEFSTKAKGELDTLGKTSKETNEALDKIGKDQLALAQRMQEIEQSGSKQKDDADAPQTYGQMFVKSTAFSAFSAGQSSKVSVELGAEKFKNTILEGTGGGSNALVAPLRRDGVIMGPARNLRVEQVLQSADTTSNAVQYTREASFTNNAAETAEGAQKPESALTFGLVTEPVQTIAHWLKISRQLSKDAPALVAYIDGRLRYGVNKRAEDQIISGNGTDPNIKGLLATGNFTAHGYSAATLGAVNPKFKLIRRMIADLATGDYPADVIMMNGSDWADLELVTTTQNEYLVGDVQAAAQPTLWGLPVIATNAIPAGTVIVMSRMAATVYNREGVVVEMSESDSDNFTKNLITIRAERRLMLAVEIPQAIRAGSLTPA